MEPSRSSPEALRAQGCGRPLGRYTLLRRLAQGGMAEVYLARAPDASGFARPVAIKKILPQFSHNERFIEMLRDEAKIAVALTHPNIAQVYELGLDGEDYFIVMEYVPGRPLNKLMQRIEEEGLTAIPVAHATYIMAEIAKGLDHAHRQTDARGYSRNIVHRDVSPQNVLISYTGEVKLIDFGIARAEGRVNQTSRGVIKGKLRYLAPEIAGGREPDHRADIYCCGIVLFEMLTGEAMFAPRSDAEAIELATQARVKSPRARNPRVPEALDAICGRALRKARDQRYPTAYDLYADLTAFLRQYEPGFAEGSLAGLMRTLFRPQMIAERSLNAAAAALVEEDRPPEVAEEPTVATAAPESLYPQLVTLTEVPHAEATLRGAAMVIVGGADGGEAMVVVPADEAGHGPPKSAAGAPGAKLEQEGRRAPLAPPEDEQAPFTRPPLRSPPAVPSAKAAGQYSTTASRVDSARDGAPAVALAPTGSLEGLEPAPAERPMSGRMQTAAAAVAQRDASSGAAQPMTELWGAPRDSTFAAVGVAAVALGAATLAGFMFMSGLGEPAVIPTRVAPVDLPPVPVSAPVARPAPELTLMVSPDVPVTVSVDGQVRHEGADPVILSGLVAERVHRLVVAADGYRTLSLSRVLKPGEQRTIELVLEPITGAIRVVGARGQVRASAGRVEGDRIADIPLGTRVSVTVERPGARPFERVVEVTRPTEFRLEVPAPKPSRRPPPEPAGWGTLSITSRPPSTVYVDGERRGQTPLSLRVAAGVHDIVLESSSGRTLSVRRSVRPDRTTTFVYRWPR